jgi:hypothetical protein
LDFLFEWGEDQAYDAFGHVEELGDQTVRFYLNMRRRIGEAMPEDIKKLQDFVNPEYVTPLLMLSLVDYFEHWEERAGGIIPDKDEAELGLLTSRLVSNSIRLLFNDGLCAAFDPPLRRVGEQMVEEIFNRKSRQLWPDYHTFYVKAQYQAVVDDYINAMRDMTLKQRRGNAPVQGEKGALARRFGVASVATFDNRVRSDYRELMDIVDWEGTDGVLVLKLHPLEAVIYGRLKASTVLRNYNGRSVPTLSAEEVAEIARGLGYRDEETSLALQLLTARGYTRLDEKAELIHVVETGPRPDDLESELGRLRQTLEGIPGDLVESSRLESFREALTVIGGCLATAAGMPEPSDEELDEVQTRIADLDAEVRSTLAARGEEWQDALNSLVVDVKRTLIELGQSDTLDRQITGQMDFVMHLNELRLGLAEVRKRLLRQYDEVKQSLLSVEDGQGGDLTRDVLALHARVLAGQTKFDGLEADRAQLENQVALLAKWGMVLRDADTLFNDLGRLHDLRDQLTGQVVPQIRADFAKRKLDALEDWEQFAGKIGAIEQELEKRRRYGNQLFGETKEEYESLLRLIEVEEYRPRTRYTYGDDEGSYGDLHEEVKRKIEHRLRELREDLNRIKVDLLKARYIQAPSSEEGAQIVTKVEEQLLHTDDKLERLEHTLAAPLIRNAGDDLADYCEEVNAVAASAQDMHEVIGPVLFSHPGLDDDEERTLQAFQGRDDVDVADLFVQFRQTGQEIQLDDLMSVLERLYRKNRVMIRVRRRA